MALGFGFSGDGLSTSSVTFLTGKLCDSSFHPVHDPFGVLAVTECLF